MIDIKRLSRIATICTGLLLALSVLFASAAMAGERDDEARAAILQYMQDKYGLNKEQVVTRLAAQAEATAIHPGLKEFLGDAYAGAWFDNDTLQLVVAITDPALEDWVKVAGAKPVLVKRGLAELRRIKSELGQESARSGQWGEAVTSWYIDYQTNKVVVEILPEHWGIPQSLAAGLSVDLTAIRFEVSPGRPTLEYDVRGGNPAGPCSVGFSVQNGFVWAGHCSTTIGESVAAQNGQVIGSVAASDWPEFDRGWVSANSSAVLLPEINGFDNGIFSVSGAQDALEDTDVCRFGKTTEGPHCGTVTGVDQNVRFTDPFTLQIVTVKGLTRADGVCSAGGDSGGPYVKAGTGTGVGTHTGGSGGCTESAVKYFHPLNDSLSRFGLTLLTANGSSPPQITGFICPDMANSGSGMFHCFVVYESQGQTQVDWTGPGTPAGDSFFGSCGAFDHVLVSVTISNAYGSDGRNASFNCPTNPIP